MQQAVTRFHPWVMSGATNKEIIPSYLSCGFPIRNVKWARPYIWHKLSLREEKTSSVHTKDWNQVFLFFYFFFQAGNMIFLAFQFHWSTSWSFSYQSVALLYWKLQELNSYCIYSSYMWGGCHFIWWRKGIFYVFGSSETPSISYIAMDQYVTSSAILFNKKAHSIH